MTNFLGSGISITTAFVTMIFLMMAIIGIIVIVRYFSRSSDQTPFTWVEPEELLRVQLTHGQIDEDAFQSKLANLRERQ